MSYIRQAKLQPDSLEVRRNNQSEISSSHSIGAGIIIMSMSLDFFDYLSCNTYLVTDLLKCIFGVFCVE